MRKKLIIACMAIVAFAAFIGMPMASGAVLTHSGTAVPVGTSFTAKGEFKITAFGNTVFCVSAHVSGTITSNSSGTIASEIAAGNPSLTGTGTGGDCTSEGLGSVKPTVNSKLCLHVAKGTDSVTVTGCGANVTFTVNVTSLGLNCKYETASASGSIATSPSDAEVNLSEQNATGEASNSFLCPGSFKIDWRLVLVFTSGETLTFS